MATLLERQRHFVVDGRAHIVAGCCGIGEACENIQLGNQPCHALQAIQSLVDGFAKVFDDSFFTHQRLFLGTEDPGFVFLEFGGCIAFGVGERLPAVVVFGNGVPIRLGDLDVIAEHAIESHLQRGNAGALSFPLLKAGDEPLAPVS